MVRRDMRRDEDLPSDTPQSSTACNRRMRMSQHNAISQGTDVTDRTADMWYAETRLVCTQAPNNTTYTHSELQGPERIKSAYAYRTLLEHSRSGVLPLGSDFPVESINPLFGFYAAVARLDHKGDSPHGSGGWSVFSCLSFWSDCAHAICRYSSERLTRAQALKGMTLDAAYAAFAEDTLGSLTPGKRADLVVLDHDIMDEAKPFSEILETKVKATVVDGKIAYGGI